MWFVISLSRKLDIEIFTGKLPFSYTHLSKPIKHLKDNIESDCMNLEAKREAKVLQK